MRKIAIAMMAACLNAGVADAQTNRIDTVRPDAPELAGYGDHAIGVTTLTMTNPDQDDILSVTADQPIPTYDRELTVEVWYPTTAEGEATPYSVFLRDGETEVELFGRAQRDAEPFAEDGPYPLVIISHGYPGNRFLMSHFGETLASKGYVTVSIDHRDSTYRDQAAFGSTLVNRSLDQTFVLDEVARLSEEDGHLLSGLVDVSSTGLIGYSMGAYGAVITAGGGLAEAAPTYEWSAPGETMARHVAGSDSHAALVDERIKAAVAIAPWGRQRDAWDAEGLSDITIPMFYIAGSADDVSGYEDGTRKIFEETTGAERYLLTFANANHNAAAPIPAPAATYDEASDVFGHYADAVWDTARMNNIAQHFVTAFLGLNLKGEDDMTPYLDLVENARDGVYSVAEDGSENDDHTYWAGFGDRTAKGLTLMRAMPEGE